jgi:hypothetical protein
MENIVDDYVNEITDNDDFKKLIELKRIIDSKYKNEIISFKTAESKYLEASNYGKYYPNLEELRRDFSNKKKELYSKEEVREYFDLERKINDSINNDINELKEIVLDNKYNNKKCIK